MDKDLKCLYLHHGDPYLRLCPFKYEPLNNDPHIGLFRDFFSPSDVESLKSEGLDGGLHSTPYTVPGGETRLFTSQRVSKRLHLHDDDSAAAEAASRKISLATRWRVHQEFSASEHFHLINYGIGGQIEVHVDNWGPGAHSHPGGARHKNWKSHQSISRLQNRFLYRIVTFLGYLSEPESGGRTVFPQLGLSVKPEAGTALFWLTAKEDGDYDSRMFHMGCPVLHGDKWVVTKWVYADEQMWNWPCERANNNAAKNFEPFSNGGRARPIEL